MQIWKRRNEAYSNKKNSKSSPFVVKSVLESNCKRFRDTAKRENFNPKNWARDEKKLLLIGDAIIFTNITKKNRMQSLPAEIFACICRYFYLRISLPAAFAGNFARASFTVYTGALTHKMWIRNTLFKPPTLGSYLISRKLFSLAVFRKWTFQCESVVSRKKKTKEKSL